MAPRHDGTVAPRHPCIAQAHPLHPSRRMPIARMLVLLFVLCCTIDVAAQVPPPKEPPPLWDFQIGASFVGTSGNSDTASTGADLAARRRGLVWLIDATATAVRTNSNDVTTAERYLEAVRAQRKLSPI